VGHLYPFLLFPSLLEQTFKTDKVHQSGSVGRIHCYFAKANTKRQYFISCFSEATDSPVKCARDAAIRVTSRGIHLYP